MIEAAEARGPHRAGPDDDRRGDQSGNTGIALAFVCAAKGYDLVLTLPQGMSREREALLRLYGARVEIIESMGGMNEAVEAARAMARARRRLPARPVLQPGQPRGPPPHDRPGDPGGARRPRRRVRRRRRAPAGRSPAPARCSRSATRSCRVVAVEPAARAVLSGGAPGPAPDPGHRRRLRARRCSTASCSTR